ncbi:hypothetical protein [Boudabousia marimammalium]|uniref:ABC transporter permease n=1 Tax=Boudabousia marimammalium TaxID=156892 RepID=A0A1Q5PSD1_9ACTO|nr:hypothetical protein [Boudabousia marimammalium]OKL50487.1 hypothetical protein BM477_00485 [Boudabousia marimammalium]
MSTLLRLNLKTRRFYLAAWLLAVIGFMAAMPEAHRASFPEIAELQEIVPTFRGNDGITMLYGPIPEPVNLANFAVWKIGVVLQIVVAAMIILLAVGMTRTQEEQGNTELLRAAGLKPSAPFWAAATIVYGTALAVGMGSGLALAIGGAHIEDFAVSESLLYGATFSLEIAAYGTIALLAAQVAASGRAAKLCAFGFVLLAYVLRGIADVADTKWLHWFTPMGWHNLTGPYRENEWWPLAPMLLIVLALGWLAAHMSQSRDLFATWRWRAAGAVAGAGDAPTSAGTPAAAAPSATPYTPDTLTTSAANPQPAKGYSLLGLRLRMQRSTILSWLGGLLVMSVLWGSIVGNVGQMLEDSERMREMIAAMGGTSEPATAYLLMVGNMLAILLTIMAVQLVLSARNYERRGYLANEAASGISVRRSVFFSWLVGVAAFIVSAVAVTVVLGAVAQAGSEADLGDTFIWVMFGSVGPALAAAGFVLLLLVLVPRASWLVWLPIAWSAFVSILGELLKLDDWVQDASLFAWAVRQSDGSNHWTGALVLGGAGLLMVLMAVVLAGRRDMESA